MDIYNISGNHHLELSKEMYIHNSREINLSI